MKTLILDNSHLPEMLGKDVTIESLRKPEQNQEDYDIWVSKELDRIFQDGVYDIIILPYSLSDENYMNYSGLRVAAHIRLTKEWKHTRKPILFIGKESPSFVAKFSSLGDILFTPYVFVSQNANLNLDTMNQTFNRDMEPEMNDQLYDKFIHKIQVSPPAKFDTHHTLANEWAIQRWSNMLGIELKNSWTELKNRLFFKYLRAKTGDPQEFGKKWHKNNTNIAKIQLPGSVDRRYKIAYIDDEYNKGWDLLLKHICKESGFDEPAIFTGFHPYQTEEDLINSIKDFIDKNDNRIDCYLLDLRLHETDFDTKRNFRDITGHKIAEYIKSKNKANQIVIFTASNKVWNLKEELITIGATGYVIKESPEMVYDRQNSYKNFQDFQNTIREAILQSYIKSYVKILDGGKGPNMIILDSFINLLLLDKTKEKEQVKSSLLLQLILFIETHIKDNFQFLDGDNLYNSSTSEKIVDIQNRIMYHFTDEDGRFTPIEVSFPSPNQRQKETTYDKYVHAKDKNGKVHDITIIIAALKYYYQFSNETINLILKAKNQRNKHIAHNGGKISMNIEDIKLIFENVIIRILEKDQQA